MTIQEIYEDLKTHTFYDLDKVYTYLYKHYKIKPIPLPESDTIMGEDVYELPDGKLIVAGVNSCNRHLKIKCTYILIIP